MMRKNGTQKSEPKIVVVNGERIFTTNIETYAIKTGYFFHRNNVKGGFFTINKKLWDNYEFKYLYIKLYKGKEYFIYSDNELVKKMNDATKLINKLILGSENHDKCKRQIKEIQEKYVFIDENIEEFAKKIDSAFKVL